MRLAPRSRARYSLRVETRPAKAAVPVAPDPKVAKRANFDSYLANVASGSLEATNKPVQLFLEVSSRCNLRCKKCGFSYDPSLAKTGRDLSWPILARMDEFFAAAVEVYTFGYQFTIAAVERSHPDETLLLFESPVFRTAEMRQAAKLGRGQKTPPKGPNISAGTRAMCNASAAT